MVIWLFSVSAFAGTLTGTVRGADGTPLANTEVLAINMRLQAIRTNTSEDGRFSFPMLPEGRYRVSAIPDSDDPHTPRYYPDHLHYCDGEILNVSSTPVHADLTLPQAQHPPPPMPPFAML